MKGQGYLYDTVLGSLKKIRDRQGLGGSNNPSTIGKYAAIITTTIGGTATQTIFPSTVTTITNAVDGATDWTIAGLNNYNAKYTIKLFQK